MAAVKQAIKVMAEAVSANKRLTQWKHLPLGMFARIVEAFSRKRASESEQ
jgi:hypothetical protein